MTQQCEKESYFKAYNYIMKDAEYIDDKCKVVVSDTLIYIERVTFFKELSVYYGTKEREMFMILDNKDKEKYFSPSFLGLSRAFFVPDKPKYKMFFSKRIDDILVVEVLPLGNNDQNKDVNQLRSFNTSVLYLFLFDDKNKIIQVYSKEMAYS
jgi:hypothetical protein